MALNRVRADDPYPSQMPLWSHWEVPRQLEDDWVTPLLVTAIYIRRPHATIRRFPAYCFIVESDVLETARESKKNKEARNFIARAIKQARKKMRRKTMPRQSPAVTRALKLVAKGMTAYAAAKKTGIALSTIYRAIKRQRNA